MEHPHEPESIPLDRVRRKGEREAAPAATQPDIQGKGHERLRYKTHWRGRGQRKRSGKKREKADRTQDALRRRLAVALTPDSAIVWGAWAVRVLAAAHVVLTAGLRLGGLLQGQGLGAEAAQRCQWSCSGGQARGGQLLIFHRVTQMRGEEGKADSLSARRPPDGRRDYVGAPCRTLSTSRFLKSSLGPQVCSHPPRALPMPTHCWHVSGGHPAPSYGPAGPALSDA